MKVEKFEVSMDIPEGVEVSVEGNLVTVKGAKGENKRNFRDPRVKILKKDNSLVISSEMATKREKKVIHTFRAHIRNMFKGIKEGCVYKLKICSGHFPMNVSVSGSSFSVKNFLGEKVPRVVEIKPGAKVNVDGDMVTVEAADKEICGQVAADIEQLTRVTNRDRRIFQDGIYLIEKDGKEIK